MNLEFRPPKSKVELESIFKLRQNVYSEDDALNNMIHPSNQLDINEYDVEAWHFGAFNSGQAIACIRFTVEDRTSQSDWVEELIALNEIELLTKTHPFPFQNYYPDIEWGRNFLKELVGKRIGEVGKLAVQKSHRNTEHLLDQFISAFLEYCRDILDVDTGFGVCSLLLERYYRRFGFYVADGAKPFTKDNLPEALVLRFDPKEATSF